MERILAQAAKRSFRSPNFRSSQGDGSENQMRVPENKKQEIIDAAIRLQSGRAAAREFGISYSTVYYFMAQMGIHFPSSKEIAKKKNDFVEHNGMTFFWSKAGGYRGNKDGVRYNLSDILYREKFGTERPKNTVMDFADGNRKNISLDNIRFLTRAEKAIEQYNNDPEKQKKWLLEGSKKIHEIERRKPWLASRRSKRAWSARRENDPENDWAKKMVESKRKRFEETGSFFKNPEAARRNMSKAHVGLTREKIAKNKAMADRRAIAQKLGIRL